MPAATYIYEVFFADQGKLADLDEQSHSSSYLRKVRVQIESEINPRNVRTNEEAIRLENAVQAEIARKRRYGETLKFRRLWTPATPPPPARRPHAGQRP